MGRAKGLLKRQQLKNKMNAGKKTEDTCDWRIILKLRTQDNYIRHISSVRFVSYLTFTLALYIFLKKLKCSEIYKEL